MNKEKKYYYTFVVDTVNHGVLPVCDPKTDKLYDGYFTIKQKNIVQKKVYNQIKKLIRNVELLYDNHTQLVISKFPSEEIADDDNCYSPISEESYYTMHMI
tara:strand:+ start:112 stop:414 length:303 start_codon:yes stop_codon:yes gene_type:complete